jgi:hypothetical protein
MQRMPTLDGKIKGISLSGRFQNGNAGEDWFPLLFDVSNTVSGKLPSSSTSALSQLAFTRFEELPFFHSLPDDLNFDDLHQIQLDYLPVNPNIIERVETFVCDHNLRPPLIGCHYRGTDKTIEAERVSYADVLQVLREQIEKTGPDTTLFIASDEAGFVEYLASNLPKIKLVSAAHKRSTTTKPLHTKVDDFGRQRAIEALTDCLLLSRCSTLVKTPSLLSTWAKIFNPTVRIVALGRPNPNATWFPENLLYLGV